MKNKFNRCCCPGGGDLEEHTIIGDSLAQIVFGPTRHEILWGTDDPLVVIARERGSRYGAAFVLFNVPIPRGATITSTTLSFLSFASYGLPDYGDFKVSIQAGVFVPLDGQPYTNRIVEEAQLTETEVLWDQSDTPWERGYQPVIPDLAAIIQELVDRDDWTPRRSDIVIIMRPVIDTRQRYIRRWDFPTTITYV